jgi:hypothetical protein
MLEDCEFCGAYETDTSVGFATALDWLRVLGG